jgi:protein arginine kinase activator
MLHRCDRCDNPASVHLTEIRGKEKSERHLCENCARALHVPQASKELQKLLKTFAPGQVPGGEPAAGTDRACPECGMTWAEFRQHGRFGCSSDYEVFAKEIDRLLKRIHGSTEYTGKSPGGTPVERGREMNELERVRQALAEAVEEENYEEAARLRDEMYRLSDVGEPGEAPGEEEGA